MHKQALDALASARPAIARLDRSRNAKELAGDLKLAWTGVESSLRALLGSSTLSGQPLIREARQRHMLTLDLANALAQFNSARERSGDAAYFPSEVDIDAAREGFVKLEAALQSDTIGRPTPSQGEAMSTKGLRLSPLGTPRPVPLPPERQPWWFLVIGLLIIVVLAALAAGAWMFFRRGPTSVDRAVAAYSAGQHQVATAEFERVIRDDPRNATAHVYLARLAMESGNTALAREHATLAVQAEPGNAVALREMGAILLAAQDYEMARRFYIRAVEAAPDDRTAQGYLGCTLLRLGRTDEGARWLERAGPGSWNECAQAPPPPATL